MVTRGFGGRQPRPISPTAAARPVSDRGLPGSVGRADAAYQPGDWTFTLKVGPKPVANGAGPSSTRCRRPQIRDIHCVTKWSKFDTAWEGVLVDDILAAAGIDEPPTDFVLAHSFDGYTTNVPLADLVGGKAMVALRYDGKPLPPDHGGPARLLVPHLYFWKSAKWVNGLQFTERDKAGFWELRGYHIYGDPWREQRYTDD